MLTPIKQINIKIPKDVLLLLFMFEQVQGMIEKRISQQYYNSRDCQHKNDSHY